MFGFGHSLVVLGSQGGVSDAADGGALPGLDFSFLNMTMTVVDDVTPANNFSGSPTSKFTYTSPSTKWIRDASGIYVSGTTLRTEYDASLNALGLRYEPAATNVVLHNRDLTNAAWVKSSVTAAKDQTGIDGSANSASSITATGANGTVLQSITLASTSRTQSAFVKRLTGSGNLQMTTDNGTTWTTVTVTASWDKVTIPAQTLANPTVGFRIVTSGDAFAIDFVQNETGPRYTSPIATTTASVTRNADTITLSTTLFPLGLTEFSLYAKIRPLDVATGTHFSHGNWAVTGDGVAFYTSSGANISFISDAYAAVALFSSAVLSVETPYKVAVRVKANDFAGSVNGAGASTDGAGAMLTISGNLVIGGSLISGQVGYGHFQEGSVLPRGLTNTELKTLSTL